VEKGTKADQKKETGKKTWVEESLSPRSTRLLENQRKGTVREPGQQAALFGQEKKRVRANRRVRLNAGGKKNGRNGGGGWPTLKGWKEKHPELTD